MAQTVRFTRALSTALVTAIQAALDTGTGATIALYTGTMPATPETGITSQVLLGTCACRVVASGGVGTVNPGTGVLTFATIANDSSADNSGTATWARFRRSDGTAIFDCDIGVVGSGAGIEMVTTTVVATGPIAFTAGTIVF